MSEYQQFLDEKNLVNQYIEAGYEISSVKENLSGMFVELIASNTVEKNSITVLLTTADARKYVATKMLYA